MEVSRRRILIKHLEPARPLRRCAQVEAEPQISAASCSQTLTEQEIKVDIEQFFKIVNLHKQNKARISYTRDFLIHLASSPEAKKKPQYLPEHPIVLSEARNPGQLELGSMRWTGGKYDVEAERLYSQ
ncbi:uncharacterized protein C8orf88 homolog [Kryptolebias marmoratus]|uniref:uncharacterized protein C8orf88 homolog n=1 Tax=Kryptolebias marmoratus TaxID=37003 RepID=UPI0007F8718D|nr:uncharacterized protein C8orf88 homolog [Kryptolebias marmoratus]